MSATVRASLLGVLSILFAAAFTINATTIRSQPIWCGWDLLADSLVRSQKRSGSRTGLCVFEDLAAYHLWFRGHSTATYGVFLVHGVDGIANDPAYFLPRGFGEVPVISLDECDGDDLYIAFRSRSIKVSGEAVLTLLAAEKPLSLFTERGLKPEIVDSITVGGETAYLVHLTR
jgi:hypothetical protein